MVSIQERMKAFNANTGSSNKCGACGKVVYSADPQITLDGYKYHKACAKCQDCACQITIRNFTKTDNLLLCKTHYFKRFHEEGSYMGGEKFIKSSKSADSTESSSTLRAAAAAGVGVGVEVVASEKVVEAASPETECQA